MRSILVLAVALVLGTTVPASADTFYGFSWTSIADYFNFNPSTFDADTAHGELTGSGVLRLSPAPDGGSTFMFDGVGGSGFGQTNADGLIAPEFGVGSINFPIPDGVPVFTSSPPFADGVLFLEGADLTIGYFEGTSPHCLFDCWSIEFIGTGTQIAQASEPFGGLLTLAGLAAAAALRRRLRGERR